MVTGELEAKVAEINGSLSFLALEVRGGKFYVRGTFPPQPDDTEHSKPYRQRVALGYPADAKGLRAAEPFARRLALQLAEDKHSREPKFWQVAQPHKFGEQVVIRTEATLSGLWAQYEAFKKPMLSPNTFNKDFRRYRNHIAKLPQDIEQAAEIRLVALERMSPSSAKRLLVNISACCRWAKKSGLIESNPFLDLAQDIKVPKSEEFDIDPFTEEERDLIIEAFEQSKLYGYYAPFVKFCFFTGCRPSEAVALQWQDIKGSRVHFHKTAYEGKCTQVKEGLKTQSERYFPINDQLSGLLKSIRHPGVQPEEYIFRSKRGGLIDLGDFNSHAWKGHTNRHGKYVPGIVTKLFGKANYRDFYQARHTFITLCLRHGIDAKDVAGWVGNSPEIIYRHYAGRNKKQIVPNL